MMATTAYVRIDDTSLGRTQTVAAAATTAAAGEVGTAGGTDHRTSTAAVTTKGSQTESSLKMQHHWTKMREETHARVACKLDPRSIIRRQQK